MRVGHGSDVHRLIPNRRLVLGGVEIEYDYGLDAHSDGDVVLHALCDALLGASGLGDIGRHFPDTQDRYRDIDSRVLLREVVSMVTNAGFRVHNADLTIVAQQPKLAPYMSSMQHNIAQDLGVRPTQVNLKATTTEGLGFVGHKEGMMADAVVLLDE